MMPLLAASAPQPLLNSVLSDTFQPDPIFQDANAVVTQVQEAPPLEPTGGNSTNGTETADGGAAAPTFQLRTSSQPLASTSLKNYCARQALPSDWEAASPTKSGWQTWQELVVALARSDAVAAPDGCMAFTEKRDQVYVQLGGSVPACMLLPAAWGCSWHPPPLRAHCCSSCMANPSSSCLLLASAASLSGGPAAPPSCSPPAPCPAPPTCRQ